MQKLQLMVEILHAFAVQQPFSSATGSVWSTPVHMRASVVAAGVSFLDAASSCCTQRQFSC